MSKYYLFIQVKGSRIVKLDLHLIILNPKSTGNNYLQINKVACQNEKHKIHYLRTALFVKQFFFLF